MAMGLAWSGPRTGLGLFPDPDLKGLGGAENEPGQFLITPQRHAC